MHEPVGRDIAVKDTLRSPLGLMRQLKSLRSHSRTFYETTIQILECKTSSTAGIGMANLPCQFPFTLRNKTYHSCTFDFSHITEYLPWCSTKVDDLGNHISAGNNWGICDDLANCPIPPRCGYQSRSLGQKFCGTVVQRHPSDYGVMGLTRARRWAFISPPILPFLFCYRPESRNFLVARGE